MDRTTQIRALLRSITGADRPTFDFHLMEVVAVEGDLCRARIGDFELPDIRLAAIAGGSENGLRIVPAPGSIILVADLSCGNLRELNAVGYSEVESVRYHRGKTTLEADADGATLTVGGSKVRIEDGGITFNDGANDGLVKIAELRRSLESLKSYCETLKAATAEGIGAAGPGGEGAAVNFEIAMASSAICIENMENDKVKH